MLQSEALPSLRPQRNSVKVTHLLLIANSSNAYQLQAKCMFCSATFDSEREYIHICVAHPTEANEFYTTKLENVLKLQYDMLRARCLESNINEDKLPAMQINRHGGAIAVTLIGNHKFC